MSILSVDNISPIGSGTSVTVNSAATLVLTNANSTGVITATSFHGSGANLTGISQVGGASGADFNDNVKLRFGTGNDLEIYHSGTVSFIDDLTGGSDGVSVRGKNVRLQSNANIGAKSAINCIANGAVELFYNDSKKFETTNTGAVVTGICTATSFSGSGEGLTRTTQLSHRNIIVNGAMQVAQRGTSSTSSGYYTVDRFKVINTGTDESPTQAQVDVSSTTTPYTLGFRKALRVTNGNQTNGAGGGDFIWIQTILEAQDIANSGWNYNSASSFITLSFWVKSSVAQDFKGYLRSRDGTNYEYPFATGSLSADTWTKVTKTISGNSNLQFDTDNDAGLEINILPFLGTDRTDGSVTEDAWATYNSSARTKDHTSTWFTTNDATFELTGVQLEVGEQATPFEHRSFNEELLRCYRYYYRLKGDNNKTYMTGMSDNDNVNIYGFFHFPVPMRIAPTAIEQNGTAGHYKVRRDTTKSCTAVPAFVDAMDFYCRVNFPSSGHGWGTGQMLWCQGGSSSSYIGFSVELN